MSNRPGQEEQLLIAIDQLRRRKTRTDLEGICNFMQRRFLINPKRTQTILNLMLTSSNAKVMAVICKGGRGTSYRRAKPGIASPMKVGDDVGSEVATAVVCGALSEILILEPQYLETGVPLDALQKFLSKKDKVRFSEPMVLALVRAELTKGSITQRSESGNLELCTQNGVEVKQPLLALDKAIEGVHMDEPEKKAPISKDAKRAARNEARKLARREARKEAKREAESRKASPVNGETLAVSAKDVDVVTSTTVEEAEGGRLRRKRAVRVVFDPSDIPPPPRKKKPPPSKDGTYSPPSGGKNQSENTTGRIPSQEKRPPIRRASSQDTIPTSHRKILPHPEKQVIEKEKPPPGKKSVLAKGSAEKETDNEETANQATQMAFMKLEKGFTRIHQSIEVKAAAPSQVKTAQDRNQDKMINLAKVKTYSAEKKIKVEAGPESFPKKVVEVYSSSVPKPASAEKEAALLLMKERATIQTQNIIQARLASTETPLKETKMYPPQIKTEKSPPGTDKLAFALSAVCYICHRPADDTPLMTCTDCANTAHIRCTERRHALRRNAPWRCVHCKTCCVCAETDEYAAMVVCCRCEDAYHLSCHPTQEEEEGSANWLCAKCLVMPRDRLPINENPDELESEGTSGLSTPATPSTPAKNDAPINHTGQSNGHHAPTPSNTEPHPEVPDATDWSVNQVADYFSERGYHLQGKALRANEIDGASLLLMRRGDVISGLNLPLGPALKAFRQIRRLQLRQNDDHLLWT